MNTIRLTMSQALVRFLDQQYVELDSKEYKFIKGVFGIFGHGNVTGLGEALEFEETTLTFHQGHNEQGMVHTATAFAKQMNRLQTYACTSSIGPGAMNMVAGAATATANRIPVLLLPGDVFACRQPDPVLQQIELPHDYTVNANDCFKPVSRYWDRIERPEQLMTAALNAMRVLTDPVDTGAVTLCLPQDVQDEAYDYPASFFERRVYHLDRRTPSQRSLEDALTKISRAKKPLIIAGGGVHYSLAVDSLREFASTFKIPVAATQAGKSAMDWSDPMSVGGIGVTGTKAANILAKETDLILAIGTRLADFTTASKSAFQNSDVELLQINISAFDGYKMGATLLQADAKAALMALSASLEKNSYQTDTTYQGHIAALRDEWHEETERLFNLNCDNGIKQTAVIGALNEFMQPNDIIVCAAGSLPGDLHRLWRSKNPKTYHLEYAFSTMGYEVAGGLGVKMANPDSEVYVILGDGSYLMLHSELLTSLQEGYKINIVLLDNHGYGCIKGLQMSQGSEGFGNDFCYRNHETGCLDDQIIDIDFAGYAKSLGAKSFRANTVSEFKTYLDQARTETVSTLIELKVEPGSMSGGYESWWRVGVAEVSKSEKVEEAHQKMAAMIQQARKY